MGRVAFVLFLVLAMPIGIHHLFADPHIGRGSSSCTVFCGVVIPTLLTAPQDGLLGAVVCGGRGLLGLGCSAALGIGRSCCDRSLVMLGLGGAGGLVNMSYHRFDDSQRNGSRAIST